MKISVLMPVYNTRPEHLREAMESILSQTFTDFEFLILNDASIDPCVEEVVKSFSDPRIVYAVNERNLGISGSRNRLLDMAQGEYLAVMDHDDISLPERLEKEAAFLDAHPEVGLVCCQAGSPDSDKVTDFPLDSLSIKKSLMIWCRYCHPACMMRASVLRENGLRYESLYSPCEDHALFCRMIPFTEFAVMPEVLFLYRDWEGNTSHTRKKAMEAGKLGVLAFARRDNPELWAMAEYYQKKGEIIKVLGIPVLTVEHTARHDLWKLFDVIPLLEIKRRPEGIRGLP
ncbi:glycosyltransferase family 2 protein [Mailhella massiliensis]|uniref:glycosyltransferase family 2 protein n=1 Tax=Mailhella massiliensis TaxID=1903261 RepID=UPI0023F4B8C6|nr:glycosyltransferase family A protein [Mailhella massiliensis]